MRVRVKICCISSMGEARLAVEAGADAVGLVSAMPSGPGVIPEEEIRRIARAVPPPVAAFLLTSLQEPDAVIEQQRRCRAGTIQLCDRLSPEARRAVRKALPGVRLVQVVHVAGAGSIDEAREAAEGADALLLDSGNPGLSVKQLGGTGRKHDWNISREIVENSPVPVFLAGGLSAANAAGAIRTVRPFAVDVCGGVRTDGSLDAEKLRAFMAAVRGTATAAFSGR